MSNQGTIPKSMHGTYVTLAFSKASDPQTGEFDIGICLNYLRTLEENHLRGEVPTEPIALSLCDQDAYDKALGRLTRTAGVLRSAMSEYKTSPTINVNTDRAAGEFQSALDELYRVLQAPFNEDTPEESEPPHPPEQQP